MAVVLAVGLMPLPAFAQDLAPASLSIAAESSLAGTVTYSTSGGDPISTEDGKPVSINLGADQFITLNCDWTDAFSNSSDGSTLKVWAEPAPGAVSPVVFKHEFSQEATQKVMLWENEASKIEEDEILMASGLEPMIEGLSGQIMIPVSDVYIFDGSDEGVMWTDAPGVHSFLLKAKLGDEIATNLVSYGICGVSFAEDGRVLAPTVVTTKSRRDYNWFASTQSDPVRPCGYAKTLEADGDGPCNLDLPIAAYWNGEFQAVPEFWGQSAGDDATLPKDAKVEIDSTGALKFSCTFAEYKDGSKDDEQPAKYYFRVDVSKAGEDLWPVHEPYATTATEGKSYAISETMYVQVLVNKADRPISPLDAAKAQAISELESYKDASGYRDGQKAELQSAIDSGKAAITAANTEDDVATALTAAMAAIDQIKTDADLTAEEEAAKAAQELATAKANASATLTTYKDAKDYREAQQAELEAAIADGEAAIAAATTEEDVATALMAAMAAIDKIKTDAQLTAEEKAAEEAAAKELADAKEDASAKLTTYKDAKDYRKAQQTELANAVKAGKEAIENATTKAAVEKALSDAKKKIDKIKTDAQLTADEKAAKELADAKTSAKKELSSYKKASDYASAQQTELKKAITAGNKAIDAAKTTSAVKTALKDAKAAIDKIKLKSTVSLKAWSTTYTGKQLAYKGTVTKTGSKGAVSYAYYSDSACKKSVKAANVKDAGTYYVKATVAAKGSYAAATSAAAKMTVKKAANGLTAKAAKSSFKVNKSKAQTTTVKVSKASGKVTYKSNQKKVAVTAKGKVTIAKGFKGKATVTVKAAGDKNHAAGTKTVTITVK